MAVFMLVGVFATLMAEERVVEPPPRDLLRAFLEPLKEFVSREHAVMWLALIALYKMANAYALSLSTTVPSARRRLLASRRSAGRTRCSRSGLRSRACSSEAYCSCVALWRSLVRVRRPADDRERGIPRRRARLARPSLRS
jgi:hypothetical protein